MGKRKYDINSLKRAASERGGKCLSKNYLNPQTKYKWVCSKGHKWEAIWESVRRGSWCKKCYHESKAGKKIGSTAGHSLEKIRKLISKYKHLSDFTKNHPAEAAWLIRNGFYHVETKKLKRVKPVKSTKYSYEDLKKIASRFKTKRDFKRSEGGAYSSAQKRGVLDEICSHMEVVGSRHKRAIYIFEFEDKSVYVGLTYDYEQRFRDHTEGRRKRKTTVYKKIKKGFEYTYYEQGEWLDKEAIGAREEWWINYYAENGWKILNKAKAGSLGSGLQVWNFEKAIEEASKYDSPNDFKQKKPGAYSYLIRNGHEADLRRVLKRKTIKWTEKELREIALKYTDYSDFCKNEPKVKSAASNRGVLKEITAHMKRKYRKPSEVTEKEIVEAAKLCRTRQEFIEKNRNLHYHAKKKGILKKVYSYLKK